LHVRFTQKAMSNVLRPPSVLSLAELNRRFPDERAARRFVERAVWPRGRVCHHCGSPHTAIAGGRRPRAGVYRCLDCRKSFTVTTGTVLHATKVPLRTWILAAHLIVSAPNGITSVHLATLLGVPQKTAWRMGATIRELMARSLARRSGSSQPITDANQGDHPVGDADPGALIGGDTGRLVSRLMRIAKESTSDDQVRRMTQQTYHRVSKKHFAQYEAESEFRNVLFRSIDGSEIANKKDLKEEMYLSILFKQIK
jgi:transposase-like protein